MDTLYSIQRSLFSVYNFLPVISMMTLITLGFGLGNYGMISIFIGEFIISVAMFFLRLVFRGFSWNTEKKTIFSLFPTEASVQYPSIWIATVTFFFSALIINAQEVYNIDPMKNVGSDPNVIAQVNTPIFQSKVTNRKTRCIMIMSICSILAVLLIGYRVFFVEGGGFPQLLISGISVAIGCFGALSWNALMRQPNVGLRNMDIFGISQQLISVTQTDVKTMCELKPAAK
jgi:hypothetical protein